MPPSQYHKPETALTKARELIKCDKKSNALEILYEVMRVRRTKQWQKVLEELMMLFVELCVELRKNAHFRKAIYQYKNMSVMENTVSLEQVIRYYLDQIKSKTEEAQEVSKSAIMDIEDLDVLETPESLMLNAVSKEGTQDRSARTILMPWLKFLWDSYRLVLDLLRSNSKLEKLYHEVAHDAYNFCLKYGRKTEFKKLCELIRQHTQKVQNQLQPNTPNAINLNNPETQTLHLETRLRQLDCAMELDMYNEAFKTVEDIWSFMMISRIHAIPSLMTNYYSKAAELFRRCGCHLYHAAALHKLYTLYRDQKKNLTREELSDLGSRVLCATVSIPFPNAKVNADKFLLSGEYTVMKQKTLAGLLGLIQVPSRQSLIRDLVRHKIHTIVPPDLSKLYQVLEADFQPLKLWDLVQPALDFMSSSPDLQVYITQLHDVIVAKTLLQLSQVYQSLNFEEFIKLCPFMEPIRLERSVIELIHNLELPIRVNHLQQAIFFDKFTDLGISQCEYGGQLVSQSTHVNDPDKLSRQLTMFAQVMQQITDILEVGQSLANCRRALVHDYRKNEQALRNELLNRRCLIEARKEEIETYQSKRDQYYSIVEARRQAEQERLLKAEETNLANEAKQRELIKTEGEKARLKLRMARTSLKMFLDLKIDAKLDLKELTEEQLENFDADKLINKQKQEVKKKRKELAEKAKTMAKKLDYYTRACRIEEIPLLQANIEPEAIESRELFEQSTREIEEHSKAEHARQLKERNRLIRMKPDVQRLVAQLKEARDNRYKAKLAEWEALCDQVRSERLAERRAKQEAEAEAEAHRRAAEEAIEREKQRQRELAAEAEREKREQEAKEAAEREAVQREEESKAWIRGEVKKEEPVTVSAFSRYRQSEGGGMAFRDLRRDDTPKQPDFGRSWGSKRDRNPHTVGFDNTLSYRNDHPQDNWSRGGPRKTVPPEFDSFLHEDDSVGGSGGGWTHVGSRKESERTKPFGRGGASMCIFNRGFKSSDADTDNSTPWRREGPKAATGNSHAFEMRGGIMKKPFGSSGISSRFSSGLSEDRK
ncbi:hypothetical protein MN116_004578 [Schistosoma mekongi]|uniref:Eukaryotic translation initiation factor 3 subunit A n=1 Tax=Schistosoma mekongi TaxID=38744 RepID=A0AAE1ZCU0_SCHME|nr:hypothetical protein MN116_004578 [Schistosoma mekongi]